MTGIVYTHVLFADILLAFVLIKIDQIVACVNQIRKFDFDYQTCIRTSSFIEWEMWLIIFYQS